MLGHQNKLIADNSLDFADKLLELKNQRKAIKAGNKLQKVKRQPLAKSERTAILLKTNGRCHICGGKIEGKWDADHVLAHSGGGKHSVDNYLPAHSLCNNYRWDYLDEEFQLIMKIGIWCKNQIEKKSKLGLEVADGFVKYEKSRLRRRK